MINIGNLIATFFISGSIVSGITYLGNQYNPLVAGIVSGVPISIPSMLLINGREKQKKFIHSAFLMVTLLAIITGLTDLLMSYTNMKSINIVIITFILWCIGGFLYYQYINAKNK